MSQFNFGFITATPELALIIGNIYAYIVSPKFKLKLKLKNRVKLANQLYEFSFSGASNLSFSPGQYLEWTLPNVKTDSRGNRRYFTIASAPGDDEIQIAIKVPDESSDFKKSMLELKVGDLITAGQLAGNFIMPENKNVKLAFIAGGIGITPFVAMAKSLIKNNQKRDIKLLYFVPKISDFCFSELWKQSSNYGLQVIPVVTEPEGSSSWSGASGRLSPELVSSIMPDFRDRRFYISGPNGLVENYSHLLKRMGVKQVITDYFSGY